MRRFFFDCHGGDHRPVDSKGIEFTDADTVKDEAKRALTQLMFDERGLMDSRSTSCHVREESGYVIYGADLTPIGGWVAKGARMVR